MRSAGIDALHRARKPRGNKRFGHAMPCVFGLLHSRRGGQRIVATRSRDNGSMPRERYGKQIYLSAHQPTPEIDFTSCNTRIAPPPFVTISTMKLPPLSRCSIIL